MYTGTFGAQSLVEQLKPVTFRFQFGHVCAINAAPGKGAWALSWIIAGRRQPDRGKLFINEDVVTASHLRAVSWAVRHDEIKRFGFIKQSVRSQIQAGLKTHRQHLNITEDDIKEIFLLTEGRYDRPLSQLSHEAWRASCAIGFAHGKKIFCFPHMSFLRPGFIDEYDTLWLVDMLDFLATHHCLVIYPADIPQRHERFFDQIVSP
jgi:ABC-type uncharacterized transport system ATPase subunit